MAQSLSKIYVHLVFSTKNHYPFINSNVKERLHSYIAGTFKNMDSPVISINSTEDHIHILFRLSRKYSLSKIIEEVKKQSSRWIKDINFGNDKFAWQKGYGAFSISSSKLEAAKKYIDNQSEHHRKKSYKEEIEDFVKHYDLDECDEKFFWS